MSERVSISVLFFGAARDVVDTNPLEVSVEAPATVGSAFRQVVERFAQLERFGRSLLFAVNQEYATPETPLKDNDELAVFPPVSGGSCDYVCPLDFFELTTETIDVGQVARRVVPREGREVGGSDDTVAPVQSAKRERRCDTAGGGGLRLQRA